MTAPATPRPAPPKTPLATEGGYPDCIYIINREDELVCGKPGVTEILVRNDFGIFCVALCFDHKREHRRFYATQAAKRGRPRKP